MSNKATIETITATAAKLRATHCRTHGLDIQNQYSPSCLGCSNTSSTQWTFHLLTSITSVFSKICILLVRTMFAASRVQRHRKKGSSWGSLRQWPSDSPGWGERYIHEQIRGSNHHSSTPRRADWKLITNASVRWMTDPFCWWCIDRGGSTVPCPWCWWAPGGLSHCLAAKLLPYQRQHINEAAVLFVQMVITTSTYLCIKTITS